LLQTDHRAAQALVFLFLSRNHIRPICLKKRTWSRSRDNARLQKASAVTFVTFAFLISSPVFCRCIQCCVTFVSKIRAWYSAAASLGVDGHLYLVIHFVSFILIPFIENKINKYIGKQSIRTEQVTVATRGSVASPRIPHSKPALKRALSSGHYLSNSAVNTSNAYRTS